MKQNKKKTAGWIAAILCAALILLPGAALVAAEELDPVVEQNLMFNAQGLTDTIIGLSQEEIDGYENSTDSFTVSAISAWTGSRDEVGTLVADAVNADPTVTERAGKYTVSVPRTFEKATANFVYIYDKAMNPTSVTIDVKLPMGTTLSRAALNTVMGIGIVFIILVFLSFVISLLKFVPALVGGTKKDTTAPVKAAPKAAPAAPAAPVAPQTDDQALIAVIAAAVAAAEGTTPDQVRISGIVPAGSTGEGFYARPIRRTNRKTR